MIEICRGSSYTGILNVSCGMCQIDLDRNRLHHRDIHAKFKMRPLFAWMLTKYLNYFVFGFLQLFLEKN